MLHERRREDASERCDVGIVEDRFAAVSRRRMPQRIRSTIIFAPPCGTATADEGEGVLAKSRAKRPDGREGSRPLVELVGSREVRTGARWSKMERVGRASDSGSQT